MKKIFFSILFFSMVFTTSASAWYCESYSTNGIYGWGEHFNLSVAQNRAVYACRVNTHFTGYCSNPSCW